MKPFFYEGYRQLFGGAAGTNWSSYWKTLTDKVLFLWSGQFDGDNLLSDLDATVITVTGKDFATTYIPYTSAATFAVPDNATYEGADTDLMWFDSGGTPKTVAIKQLVNFDYARTIIKFADEDPYHVTGIMILKAGATLTEAEIDRLHKDFALWVYWADVENENGHYKDNRTIVDVPAVVSAEVPSGQSTKVAITFDLNLDEDTVPATTDFAVSGSVTGAKTISDVAISGTVVTLTVSVAFGDETVTAGYTKPTDNALRSALGGGVVATFAGQAVTNNLYGPELILNGTFSSDTVWIKSGATVTIADGVAKFINSPSGSNVSQGGSLTYNGKTFLVKIEVVSISEGAVRINLGSTLGTAYNTTGAKSETVVAGATPDLYFRAAGTTTANIDNVSLKEVL